MKAEVRLVPMSPEMYHAYFREYENDPDLFLDKSAFSSYTYEEEIVNRYIQRQIDLNRKAFGIMVGGKIVGELIIKNIVEQQCATLGLSMKNARYKDRGYGTQAELLAIEYVFHELDIPVLYADALLTNKRSQHVLEKVGFQKIKEEGNFIYYRIDR